MIKPVNGILTSKVFANEFQKAMKTQHKLTGIDSDEVIAKALTSKKQSNELSKSLLEVFIVAYANTLRKLDINKYVEFIGNISENITKNLKQQGTH